MGQDLEERLRACEKDFEDVFFPGERLKFLENLRNFGEKTFFLRTPEFSGKFTKF